MVTSPSVAPNSAFGQRRSLPRGRSASPAPRRVVSPIGVSVAQRRAQMAEQIAETAISGVGCMEEEMRHTRSVAEAAIAEAAAVSSCMESNVVHVVVQTEAKTAQAVMALAERVRESVVETEASTSHTVRSVVQQLEREIEATTMGAIVTSEMKTKSAVQGLRGESKAHLDQNRADFDWRQKETQTTIAQVSADLENLTRQLNQVKPVGEVNVSASQNKLAMEVTEKLAASDKKLKNLQKL